MNATQLADLLLEGVSYSKSCTMIELPPEHANFLINWGRLNVPDEALYTEVDDDSYGREEEMHTTVLWGIDNPDVSDRLREIAAGTAPFKLMLGAVSLFKNDKFDVVKVSVESEALRELRARIEAVEPNKQTFPDYQPHATIAYVKKGTCDALEGELPFDEDGAPSAEFLATGLLFKGSGEGDERVVEVLPFTAPVKKLKVTESDSSEPFTDSKEAMLGDGPVYYTVKVSTPNDGWYGFADPYGRLHDAPYRMTLPEAESEAEYCRSSFGPEVNVELGVAEDQSQIFWQGQPWPQAFPGRETDVRESTTLYRVAYLSNDPFPHTVHKTTPDVRFHEGRVYVHGIPRLRANVVEVLTGKVLRRDFDRWPLHENLPFDGLPFPLTPAQTKQFKQAWSSQYGRKMAVQDSLDDLGAKEVLLPVTDTTYAVSYLNFPSTGWSRFARNRPRAEKVFLVTPDVRFSGKSVIIDGVRRLRANVKNLHTGEILRRDYHDLPFEERESDVVARR